MVQPSVVMQLFQNYPIYAFFALVTIFTWISVACFLKRDQTQNQRTEEAQQIWKPAQKIVEQRSKHLKKQQEPEHKEKMGIKLEVNKPVPLTRKSSLKQVTVPGSPKKHVTIEELKKPTDLPIKEVEESAVSTKKPESQVPIILEPTIQAEVPASKNQKSNKKKKAIKKSTVESKIEESTENQGSSKSEGEPIPSSNKASQFEVVSSQKSSKKNKRNIKEEAQKANEEIQQMVNKQMDSNNSSDGTSWILVENKKDKERKVKLE